MRNTSKATKVRDKRTSLNQTRAEDKKLAMALIEEYEVSLTNGQNPDPCEFLARYPGQDKDSFKFELNLVTLLQVKASEIAKEWERLSGPLEVKKIEAKICEKLLNRGKTRQQPKKLRRKKMFK